MNDSNQDSTQDKTSNPDTAQPIPQDLPDSLGKRIAVPEELINAGKPTNLPRENNSPESLDVTDFTEER